MVQSTLEMAKDLVMAQIQVGALAPEEVYRELQKTHSCLLELKAHEEVGGTDVDFASRVTEAGTGDGRASQEQLQWKKSIKKHTIECLECGAVFKQLSVRHLKDHDLDARSYRAKYGIPRVQPLSAKETTAMRKKIVQKSRPWEKAPTYIKAHARKSTRSGRGTK
jgi:predicted transcriptional regulator